MAAIHVLLFGDQTDDVTGTIHNLYIASKKHVLLAELLRDASKSCQVEFGNELASAFRQETPPFESLLEMAENHAKTDGSPVLASCALSYFARLGELILRAENDPTILSTPRILIGLCINLFPAALAATAKSATELAELSLAGFPTFFNWVVTNHNVSKMIEWPHGSWSCIVSSRTEADLQLLLDKFHDENDTPNHKRTWIGVFGHGWVTVSGPPSILKRFMAKYSEQKDLSFKPLPVASAVHAPHLPELDCVTSPSYIWDLPQQEGACIMSTENGVPYSAGKLGDLVPNILLAILRAPLKLRATFDATAEYVKRSHTTASLSVVGPSAQAYPLIKALKKAGVDAKVLKAPYDHKLRIGPGSGAVAIVGMSARFPQANEPNEFFELLKAGRPTHKRVPPDRFNLDDFYDPTGTGKNTMMNIDGCFLSDPGAFDAKMFSISPREAMQIDPTHRLLLMTSFEALERAGYNPDADPPSQRNRTAVYFGQNSDFWRDVNAEHGIDVFTAPGILRAFSAGRVSHHFGFQGGSYSIDTACSSSATAIQIACSALVHKECDMALAGGAQVAGSPFEFSALGKSGFLAPSGGCKTFREDADGYCRGEAVGVVVLKRLEDALAAKDNIQAVVTGWGRNYSAGASFMTHPHSESQEELIRNVLRQANAKPSDIGYVEMHGTGTQAGDLAEMTTITRIFNRDSESDLHVGSLKANVGHSESAAGVSSVIKAALILRTRTIPPQAMVTHDTALHPGFGDLDMSSICINSEQATLEDTKEILVNSFDAAGGNTCLLIEQAPEPDKPDEPDPRGWYSVTVSGHTSYSLRNNQDRLMKYLATHRGAKLSDVAYSTAARRMHYSLRSQYTVDSTEELIKQLEKDLLNPDLRTTPITEKPKVVFLFSGQGSSYYGIAGELYRTHAAFRKKLNGLSDLCRSLCPGMDRPVTSLLVDESQGPRSLPGTEEQLAIVCFQLALAELWKSWGVEPDLVLGHSLGEYAALSVAGVLSTADTLWLVAQRGRLLEATYPRGEYGMLSLLATADEVRDSLQQGELHSTCAIACFNSARSHVVGGPTVDLHQLNAHAKPKGIPTQFLEMSYASHSKSTERIREKLEEIAGRVTFFTPRTPVCSTVTGEIVRQDKVFDAKHIARHLCEPVQFVEALKTTEAFLTKGHRIKTPPLWIEIGSGPTCLTLLRQTLDVSPSQLLPSIRNGESNWKTLTNSIGKAYVAGSPVNWPEFHRPFRQTVKLLDLPTYAFDLKTYWRPYTKATASAQGIKMGGGDGKPTGHTSEPAATVRRLSPVPSANAPIRITATSRGFSDNEKAAQVRAPSQVTTGNRKAKIEAAFLSALMEETGVDLVDIEDETNMSELGVNSLTWIAIVRKIEADTNLRLPVSKFSKLRTFGAVREGLSSLGDQTTTGKDDDAPSGGAKHPVRTPAEEKTIATDSLKETQN
ncbi:hypothetical protein GGR51DRAFT_564728 [Nemania sp. FL0031]|nr:hypothetical protein GGR51DRAFT_564728 [Nemania sp. FL0031]